MVTFGLLLCFAGSSATHASVTGSQAQIAVLQSAEGGPYDEFTREFRQTLRKLTADSTGNTVILVAGTDESARLNALESGDLLVAVGTRACETALNSSTHAPILCALIPRVTAEQMTAAHHPPHKVTALYLDQPFSRYFGLIRLVMPQIKRVGAVLGPVTANESVALTAAADRAHLAMQLSLFDADSENPLPALEQILRNSEVILALPDPAVYNRYTLPPLLLTTFRYRVPVFGFSPALVNAGALGGIFSTPAQIGRQAAEIALTRQIPSGGIYPRYFEVRFNPAVADALDISLPDHKRLDAFLSTQGGAP